VLSYCLVFCWPAQPEKIETVIMLTNSKAIWFEREGVIVCADYHMMLFDAAFLVFRLIRSGELIPGSINTPL